MKASLLALILFSLAGIVASAALPVITTHPTNQIVAPNNNATFVVFSANATSYQWRFTGTNIPWGTNATLVVTNAQSTDAGYYMALAKNETGCAPSQMGVLAVVGTTGKVTFNNTGNTNSKAFYQVFNCAPGFGYSIPITNATAQLFAGPNLDFMQSVSSTPVSSGLYSSSPKSVSNVAAGQETFYRVDITYPIPCGSSSFTQPSITIKVVAGSSLIGNPTPAVTNILFPTYIEWPDSLYSGPVSPTNMVGVPGETASLKYSFYSLSGNQPTSGIQWRKDGKEFGLPQSGTLTGLNFLDH